MPRAPHVLTTICEHTNKAITTLARDAGIDTTGLSKVKRGEIDLTPAMLVGIHSLDYVSRADKAALAVAFAYDRTPEELHELVMFVQRPEGQLDKAAEQSESYGDGLEDALRKLREIGQQNPAMARAIKNLVRVYEGKFDVVE
jgi:hypothetical protein